MKYIAIIDKQMLSNFRIDEPLILVVTDKMGFTRGIQLKPLPKGHGRLIDADALDLEKEVSMADDWKTAHEIANCVKYAPTIIEADKESEKN